MTDALFIIGKSGSGKTEMANIQCSLLAQDGFSPLFLSDRIGLEEAVLADVGYRGGVIGEAGLTGSHSMLLEDGPPGHRKIHVLDGSLLNLVHDQMILYVQDHHDKNVVVVAEYAIGPDVSFGSGRESLMQSGQELLIRLREHNVTNRVFIMDVEASFDIRAQRNASRPDGLDANTFAAYFRDGGEMNKRMAQRAGVRYHQHNNGHHDSARFNREAQQIYYEHVFPLLIQEGRQKGFDR